MGKIDDMRRLREAQQTDQSSSKRPASSSARASVATGEPEGRCAVCGKQRVLQNGLVSNHQKGLGKACPGSRKAPA